MANINESIKLASGFLLKGAPVDLKMTAATIEQRNSYIEANALYKGALVYVEQDNVYYVCTGEPATGEEGQKDYSPCFKPLLGDVPTMDNVVLVTGDQSISGTKTFTAAPKINSETVTTKEYVDGQIPSVISSKVGTEIQAHNDQLDKFAALGTAGFIGRKDDGSIVNFTVEGTSGQVKVTPDNATGKVTVGLENVGTAGTYFKVTTDDQGRVTSGENPTTIEGFGITDAVTQDSSGNVTITGKLTAATAEFGAVPTVTSQGNLATETFVTNAVAGANLTFSDSGTVALSKSGSTVIANLKASGVSADTYAGLTVNENGIVTTATKLTTLSQYGITDAVNVAGGELTGLLKYNGSLSESDFDDNTLITKKYADSVALGFVFHVACETGSTSNVEGSYADGDSEPGYPGVGATFTLSANTGNTTAIGGVTLTQDMRVLLVGQTDAKQNGAYTVTTVPGEATGQVVLTRVDDFDGHPTITYNGASFLIANGNHKGSVWRLENTGNVTFGTDEINFHQVFAPNNVTAGSGISISGNVVSVKQGNTVKVIDGNLEVSSGTGNTGKVLVAGGDNTAATWQSLSLDTITGVLSVSKGGTGVATLPANQLVVGNGTNAVKAVANAEGILVGTADAAPTFGKANLTKHVEGILPAANGGTGVANTNTLTLSGGDITLTASGATNVTLPTTGVLATIAGKQTLQNKTLDAPTITGNVTGAGSDPEGAHSTLDGFVLDGGTY